MIPVSKDLRDLRVKLDLSDPPELMVLMELMALLGHKGPKVNRGFKAKLAHKEYKDQQVKKETPVIPAHRDLRVKPDLPDPPVQTEQLAHRVRLAPKD